MAKRTGGCKRGRFCEPARSRYSLAEKIEREKKIQRGCGSLSIRKRSDTQGGMRPLWSVETKLDARKRAPEAELARAEWPGDSREDLRPARTPERHRQILNPKHGRVACPFLQ